MNSASTRLRTRLAFVVLLAVVPALVAIVYLQSAERERARRTTLAENLRLARLVASREAGVFEGARRLLLTLAAVPALRAKDPRSCEALLGDVLRTHPSYINLTVANSDGSLFCAAQPLDPRRYAPAKGHSWFDRAVRTRTTALGEPQISATTGRLAILVAQPLLDSSRAVTRIIAATIGLEQLSRTAAETDLPRGATVTLFDAARTILARFPDPERWIGKRIPDSTSLRRFAAGAHEDLTESVGVDGVQRLYATVPVDLSFANDLYLGMGVDHATAFAEGDRILRQYLWLLAIVSLAAIGAGVIGGQTFVLGPIKALKSVADRLAVGDLSARAQLASGVAGVGDLAGAVNAMAAALDERQRERDRAEAGLREAEERMRFALQASGVGVWEVSLSTGVAHWSETCEVMHGLVPGTFSGTFEGFLECIHDDDRDAARETIERAVAARTDAEVEYRTVWPDGSVHRISSTGRFFFDDAGKPVRGAGVCLDVTERRLLEEQLRQSLKMEAVGQLAGGVAHDFNNLLTVISGNTEFAVGALPVGSGIRDDLQQVRSAANRAAQLTRQLLAFSRKQVLRTEPVDVNDVVANITPMLRRLIGEDISVEYVAGGVGAITIADRAQLEQALINLVLNARDAMPQGGTLRLATETVRLDRVTIARQRLELDPAGGRYVVLRVTDTGSGMEPAVLVRAFEPFFTTKPVGKGTGLGLPSVYGTVKQFGGHIAMDSVPGRGTTVTIHLPQVGDDADSAPDGSAGNNGLASEARTILLVEDEEAVRRLAARILSGAGYNVLQAGAGEEALACARRHSGDIHLVLSDVVMPGMSVGELIAGMRATRPRAGILLMSGYPNDEILRKGLLDHELDLLEKPFNSDTLLARVSQALGGQRERGAGAGRGSGKREVGRGNGDAGAKASVLR